MKLLFDNNVSPKVARAVNELISPSSVSIPLRDKFPANTKDVDWIAGLGVEGGRCVISADLRITKNKAERAAWLQTDLVGFFMEPALARLPLLEQTARLLLRLPLIETQISIIHGSALFTLPIGNASKLRQL